MALTLAGPYGARRRRRSPRAGTFDPVRPRPRGAGPRRSWLSRPDARSVDVDLTKIGEEGCQAGTPSGSSGSPGPGSAGAGGSVSGVSGSSSPGSSGTGSPGSIGGYRSGSRSGSTIGTVKQTGAVPLGDRRLRPSVAMSAMPRVQDLVGEHARHDGDADLLRERIDGRTGE
jgi:Protein of unknown function (DUF664)